MKNTEVTQEKILDLYSKYVLRNNKKPLNVFTFCDDHEISESEFYFYYANFDQLEADYLKYFMQQSLLLISNEENYEEDDAKTKMLSFYFTFFEQLTINRSLVIYLIGSDKNNLDNLKKLWSLKKEFQQFIRSLDISEPLMESQNENMAKMERFKNKGIEELYWGHFLTTLKFWIEDTSSNFEKTDIFIEKSVDTSFELFEIKPLKKLIDLGKFLFNEVKNK
ncbi:TetR/AcrR family transcriptional regulator [Kaistella flava (ex Peng et al. 2021)]|uniref:TetR/AcrR family transcriptional regulator n=1 Tax=Kaistella flava (ex Peng et al. 2021) TaxID=2038776 RepID=A0A7M2Y4U6_9FLAO|nr:TetR family transcriptional regulator C-terminal domain-containing protein [Kaistella flava (ex Peng et al. 2021)]QOW09268.1 TetR/AcrR family transcriptional regulator [Kaistella flava (ex Peng et al. 2021)]